MFRDLKDKIFQRTVNNEKLSNGNNKLEKNQLPKLKIQWMSSTDQTHLKRKLVNQNIDLKKINKDKKTGKTGEIKKNTQMQCEGLTYIYIFEEIMANGNSQQS